MWYSNQIFHLLIIHSEKQNILGIKVMAKLKIKSHSLQIFSHSHEIKYAQKLVRNILVALRKKHKKESRSKQEMILLPVNNYFP